MTAEEILAKVEGVWLGAKKQLRDSLLEVGGLVHDYILARLQESDVLSQRQRYRKRLSRCGIIVEVAKRLKASRLRIWKITTASQVVALLADKSHVGELSFSTIAEFIPLVHRAKGDRRVSKANGVVHVAREAVGEASDRERWIVRQGMEQTAPALFRQAVAESWSVAQTRQGVTDLIGEKPLRGHDLKPRRQNEERLPQAPLSHLAEVASPKDLADIIIDAINRSSDPPLVFAAISRWFKNRNPHFTLAEVS